MIKHILKCQLPEKCPKYARILFVFLCNSSAEFSQRSSNPYDHQYYSYPDESYNQVQDYYYPEKSYGLWDSIRTFLFGDSVNRQDSAQLAVSLKKNNKHHSVFIYLSNLMYLLYHRALLLLDFWEMLALLSLHSMSYKIGPTHFNLRSMIWKIRFLRSMIWKMRSKVLNLLCLPYKARHQARHQALRALSAMQETICQPVLQVAKDGLLKICPTS